MILTIPQLQNILRQAGWPENLIPTMSAIGMAESAGRTDALNHTPREYSVGLFQINLNAHGTRYGSAAALQDPLTNARAALDIYNRQGLRAWGAYTDGRYRRYLDDAQAALGAAAGGVSNFFNQTFGQNSEAILSGGVGLFLLGLGVLLLIRR